MCASKYAHNLAKTCSRYTMSKAQFDLSEGQINKFYWVWSPLVQKIIMTRLYEHDDKKRSRSNYLFLVIQMQSLLFLKARSVEPMFKMSVFRKDATVMTGSKSPGSALASLQRPRCCLSCCCVNLAFLQKRDGSPRLRSPRKPSLSWSSASLRHMIWIQSRQLPKRQTASGLCVHMNLMWIHPPAATVCAKLLCFDHSS